MRYLYKHKKLFINTLLLFISTFYSHSIFAQVFDNGQNPPSLKWQQIKTKNYQVIFPTGFESEAQRTANVLEHLYNYVGKSLKIKPRKISIILQNQSVASNGFVTLAPRHSEFYTTPPQDIEPNDWINSLAVHELRHVIQMDKTTKGINIPLIEEIQFALFGGVYPIWFIEGDAVVTETALSSSGRGRVPDWQKEFQANTLANKNYSYSKYYFGSLKDNVPDYYRLGYFMTSHLRKTCGDSVFNAIFSRSKNKFYIPWPFSNAVRHYTGLSTNALFHSTVNDLKNHWQQQQKSASTNTYQVLNKRNDHVPTDYLIPKALNQNNIVFIKQGLGDVNALYHIDTTGNESKLTEIGPQLIPHFDCKNNLLVWDELRFDPRYQYRNYSVVCTYNLLTKKFKQLTRQSRYFSPSLSFDGKSIAAVKVSTGNHFNIVLLDAKTGKEFQTIPNPENYFLQTPAFNKEGSKLVFAVSSNKGRNIAVYDLKLNQHFLLFDWDFKQSLRPTFEGENILYHSSYSGIDNIYRFNIESKTIEQLTHSSLGAYNASFNPYSNQLLFNVFEERGQNISSIPLPTRRKEDATISSSFVNYSQPIVNREQGKSVLDSFPSEHYKITPYKEGAHSINFHSLSPYVENVSEENYIAGISLKSNNLLNTLALNVGYSYNQSVKSGEYFASAVYKKYYPLFGFNYTNRKRVAIFDTTINNQPTFQEFSFRENELNFNLTVPLSFYKNNYNYNIGFTSEVSYFSRYDVNNGPSNLIKKVYFPIDNTFYFYRTKRKSSRDLNPKWGQQFSIRYNSLPFDDQLDGSIFTFESSLLFPGFFKHHSFLASFNFQHNTGIFSGAIEIPEASGSSFVARNTPLENSLLLRYRFPLFYPDWEVGRLAYIKRFKGGFFTDLENINASQSLKSYGLELRADCNLLRFYLPNFDIGTKMIFLTDKSVQSPVFELILNFAL